ncbi:MAG: aspartate--tRNA ligase [Gemmatimonadetes bacterium]|nr:aspartate--tRNA ligase [Gemmatimonadota bacterium]
MTDSERTARRSRLVGGLRPADTGTVVRLAGWVHRRRDLGGLIFVDIRDRSGLAQICFGPAWTETPGFRLAQELGAEDVIAVEGDISLRPAHARNPELPTGEIEVRARTLERLSRAETPAIPVARGPSEELPAEELRLRHRHLDLRRPELQRNLILRHRLALATRRYFDGLGFLEIETPMLTKRTPEGARDYLVPSRIHRGEFYALPQSPQLYKQILMVAGLDRYFQIARCFRDEDLRADRQPEFTQIDVEASFIDTDDIIRWVEGLMVSLTQEAGLNVAEPPFPRITYRDAMARYGSDRPDLRYGLEIHDWTDLLRTLEFEILRAAVAAGGSIRGIVISGGAGASRRTIDALGETAKAAGAPGLLWVKRGPDGASGPLARVLTAGVLDALGLRDGDLALVVAAADRLSATALGAVRLAAITGLGLPPLRTDAWVWIVEFPLFEDADGALAATNHPFTAPWPADLDRLESDPLSVRSLAYDVVYNGAELGGGSLRIHEPELQRRVLRVLGLSDREIEQKFGFLLEALASGAPPHGGIALGLDRIAMHFAGAGSLRDVIAFPKTTAARALFEGAPTPVSAQELEELHLRPAAREREVEAV